MQKKAGHTFVIVAVFLISVFMGLHFILIPSAATVQGSTDSPGKTSQLFLQEESGSEKNEGSTVWHTFLWRAIPVEWIRGPRQSIILEAYQINDWKPFFIAPSFELIREAHALLERLQSLEGDAINLEPYHLGELQASIADLEQLRHSVKAAGLPKSESAHGIESPYTDLYRKAALLDIRLAESLLRLAREMDPFSQERQRAVLWGDMSIADFLKSLEPGLPRYALLRSALAHYKQLASKYGRVSLENSALRSGDRGMPVRRLQERLRQEGFYAGEAHGVFDNATQTAVRKFQRAHLLSPDGVAGTGTIAQLNVSYKEKADLIANSLRALRHSQSRLHDRFVHVNIPQYVLEYHKEGKIQTVHRVIVGKAGGKKVKTRGKWVGVNHTPVLAGAIDQIIFNPRWYVTDRIRIELNAQAANDPAYFSRRGYVEMSSSHPWGQRRVFQRPGPTNPLGRVKFEFPNPYAVYLHDTPTKQAFERGRRDLSHGCVRLDGALDFAEMLLAEDQNEAAPKVKTYLANSDRQVFVRLQHPVPIVIDYLPVSSDESGRIVFCGDPYERFKEPPVRQAKLTKP